MAATKRQAAPPRQWGCQEAIYANESSDRLREARGLWREAAREYEVALEPLPHVLWIPTSIFNPALHILDQFRLARTYDRLNDSNRAHHWYERFTEDWKDVDLDIPELIEARERLAHFQS